MLIVPPEELRSWNLCVDVVDTYVTEWKNGEQFRKFEKKRRPYSALYFVLSDLESRYSELNGEGEEVGNVFCKKGDILYLPENLLYRSRFSVPEGAPSATCTINFHLYDQQGNAVLLGEHPILLSNRVNSFMTEDLFSIHKCTTTPAACDRLRINALFFSILYDATTKSRQEKNAGTVRAAVEAIETEWNRNEKMEKYAALCNRSMTCFYREFKEYTGMSPTQYRNHIRINMAKSDMRNTNMTVREIAAKVGFEDEFYFSRLFRKMTGTSPTAFKEA